MHEITLPSYLTYHLHNEAGQLLGYITCYRGRCIRPGTCWSSWRWHRSLRGSRLIWCVLRAWCWRRSGCWCWSGDSTRTVCVWIQVIWGDAATAHSVLKRTKHAESCVIWCQITFPFLYHSQLPPKNKTIIYIYIYIDIHTYTHTHSTYQL